MTQKQFCYGFLQVLGILLGTFFTMYTLYVEYSAFTPIVFLSIPIGLISLLGGVYLKLTNSRWGVFIMYLPAMAGILSLLVVSYCFETPTFVGLLPSFLADII